jgi:hypothetical protein
MTRQVRCRLGLDAPADVTSGLIVDCAVTSLRQGIQRLGGKSKLPFSFADKGISGPTVSNAVPLSSAFTLQNPLNVIPTVDDSSFGIQLDNGRVGII